MFDKVVNTLGMQHIITLAHTEVENKLEFWVPVIN